MMVVGVAGCVERLQRQAAEANRLAFPDGQVDVRGGAFVRNCGPRSGCFTQPRGARDMIGVNVGFDRIFERQAELVEQGEVALDRVDDRIDQHGFARFAARDEIGVGRRDGLEQLTEDHLWPLAQVEHRSASARP